MDAIRTIDRRRVKLLYISPQILVDMCKHNDAPFKTIVSANALPADAEAVAIDYDVFSNSAKIVVMSASYDIVEPSVVPPTLPPVEITSISDERCEARSPSPNDPFHQQCALSRGHAGEHSRTIDSRKGER